MGEDGEEKVPVSRLSHCRDQIPDKLTPSEPHSRESDAIFWSPRASGTHRVCRRTCRQMPPHTKYKSTRTPEPETSSSAQAQGLGIALRSCKTKHVPEACRQYRLLPPSYGNVLPTHARNRLLWSNVNGPHSLTWSLPGSDVVNGRVI